MKTAITIFSLCLSAFSVSAEKISCREEGSPLFVRIDGDKSYIDVENMCLKLRCLKSPFGFNCEGMSSLYGYSIFISDQKAVVGRSNGLNYDTLGILSCTTEE